MMKEAQLLLLSLLVALFLPVQLAHFDDDSDDDACNLRTSIVEHQLKKIASTDLLSCSAQAAAMNKAVFQAVLEEQNLEKKLDHLTEEGKKVDKMAEALEKLQEFANASRMEDSKNLDQIGEKLKQLQDQGLSNANATQMEYKKLISRILNNNEDIKAQYMQVLQIRSVMDQILQAIDKTADRLGKIEKTQEETKTQVQENAKNIKRPGCQNLLQWRDVNKKNSFIADGKHFYFNDTYVTWYRAREWCTERGMQLAMLKTLSQVEAVAKEMNNHGYNDHGVWVSASDIGRTPHGQYHWQDGTPVDKATWYSGYPYRSGEGKETCVYLYTGLAKLFDNPCSDTRHFLCEFPAALSSCFE